MGMGTTTSSYGKASGKGMKQGVSKVVAR